MGIADFLRHVGVHFFLDRGIHVFVGQGRHLEEVAEYEVDEESQRNRHGVEQQEALERIMPGGDKVYGDKNDGGTMNREREEDHQQKRHQASLQDVDITAQNDSGSKRITNRKDTCDEQRKENDAWRLRVHFSGEQGPEKDRQPAFDEKENRIGIGDASDGPVQERIAELELKESGWDMHDLKNSS